MPDKTGDRSCPHHEGKVRCGWQYDSPYGVDRLYRLMVHMTTAHRWPPGDVLKRLRDAFGIKQGVR